MTRASERRRPVVRLLRKDLALLRPRYQGLIALAFVLAALQTVPVPGAYFWAGVLLALTLVGAIPLIEWRLGTDRLLASLPVRRRTIVAARYAAAALGIGVAWVAWAVLGRLLAPILAARAAAPAWATLDGTLAFVALATIAAALLLPLLFWLGLGRGSGAFAGVLLAAYAIAAAARGPAPAGIPLGRAPRPGAVMREAMAALAARTGGPGAVALTVAAGALLLWVSAWLATQAYRRREL